jgi:hypothetical protein
MILKPARPSRRIERLHPSCFAYAAHSDLCPKPEEAAAPDPRMPAGRQFPEAATGCAAVS